MYECSKIESRGSGGFVIIFCVFFVRDIFFVPICIYALDLSEMELLCMMISGIEDLK